MTAGNRWKVEANRAPNMQKSKVSWSEIDGGAFAQTEREVWMPGYRFFAGKSASSQRLDARHPLRSSRKTRISALREAQVGQSPRSSGV
jgi:hypothetical protein